MVRLEIDLNALEIIGYADRLVEAFVPQNVPPIFRLKEDPDRIIMPPFRTESHKIVYSTDGFQSDLDQAVRRGQATRLDQVIDTQPDHRLWIDESFQAHYEPADTVVETLQQLAKDRVGEALEALAEGRLGKAERLAQTAISADDTCFNAILIKGLVHQLRGDHDSVELLVEIAESMRPGADLQALIDFYSALIMDKQRRGAFHTIPRAASMVGEPNPLYTHAAGSDWQGSGGHIETEDRYSDRSIVKSLLAQYEPLTRINLSTSHENGPFVM